QAGEAPYRSDRRGHDVSALHVPCSPARCGLSRQGLAGGCAVGGQVSNLDVMEHFPGLWREKMLAKARCIAQTLALPSKERQQTLITRAKILCVQATSAHGLVKTPCCYRRRVRVPTVQSERSGEFGLGHLNTPVGIF